MSAGNEAARPDGSFVPCFRDPVDGVPVADEAVLYESDTGDLHRLDHIAAIVCSRFDGVLTVREIVDDLSAEFGAPREVIEADVLALVGNLGSKGLLVGVEADDEASSIADKPSHPVDDGC